LKVQKLYRTIIALAILKITLVATFSNIIYAQGEGYNLEGRVFDEETKEALPGAEVYVHELVKGTITDVNGYFKFTGLKPARYHIHIKYIGHHSLHQYINLSEDNQEFNFYLRASFIELMEIVIESDPFKTGAVEQSLTTQTVSNDFIIKNPGGTLMTSLLKLPGINAINTGVSIAKPVIRGLSFNRVIVTDRGIKQEGQQWGADHGLEIDQFDPEQIEIVKGPASLRYGSDGMGGVIIINNPYLAEEGTVEGQFLGLYKTNNNLLGTSTMIKGNSSGLVYQGRFSTQDFGDYKVPADSFFYNGYILPIYNNRLKNTAGKERNISGMVGLKKNWGYSTITVSNYNQQAGLFPGAVGIPREYNLEDDGDPRNIDLPRQIVNHLKIISNSNILLGGNWLEIDLGYQHNDRKEEGEPHAHGYQPEKEGILALGLDLHTYTANFRYNQVIHNKANRIFGIQYQYQVNNFKGFEFLLPSYIYNTIGGYFHEQRSFGEIFTMNYGLRLDYARINVDEHYEPDFSTENPLDSMLRNPEINRDFYNFSGGIGISYFPSHHINLKFNAGSSYRVPTPNELSVNGIHHGTFRHEKGDPDLDPERGWQFDLNFSYHINQFLISITPFYNYYNNYIYLKPTSVFSDLPGGGQIFQYTQNDAVFLGGELILDYHLMENFHVELGAEYVANYNLDTQLPLPFTPPFSTVLDIEYAAPKLSDVLTNAFISLNTRFTAAQNRVDRNENPTDGYVLLGLSLGTDINIKQQHINLSFNIQNILNTEYMNHLSRYRWLNLPEQGRNVSISLIYPFLIQKSG
jgi:iron complex outermembrane receptor protein